MSSTPPPAEIRCDQDAAAKPGFLASLSRRLEDLSSLDANPRRTAAALALGVFLSFSPFLGLQILIGFGAALALRLSRVAVLLGLCANLPWIMLPWYAITTAAAAAILGVSADVNISARLAELFQVPVYHPGFWGRTGDLVSAFFWPFVIGPSAGAFLLALAAYAAGLRFLSRRLHRRHTADAPASTGLPGDAQERAADRHIHDAQRARLQP
jgi:uncharacterized protein (DUF2062 family)